MKKYLGIMVLITVCLYAGPEQELLESIKDARGDWIEYRVKFFLKPLEPLEQRRICYNLLFNNDFLFLKNGTSYIEGSKIEVKELVRILINYLRDHKDVQKCEKEFFRLYRNHINIICVEDTEFNRKHIALNVNTEREWVLNYPAQYHEKTIHLLPYWHYSVDPYYVAFTEMKESDACPMMSHLNTLGISSEGRDYDMVNKYTGNLYHSKKNILEIIKDMVPNFEHRMRHFLTQTFNVQFCKYI